MITHAATEAAPMRVPLDVPVTAQAPVGTPEIVVLHRTNEDPPDAIYLDALDAIKVVASTAHGIPSQGGDTTNG